MVHELCEFFSNTNYSKGVGFFFGAITYESVGRPKKIKKVGRDFTVLFFSLVLEKKKAHGKSFFCPHHSSACYYVSRSVK